MPENNAHQEDFITSSHIRQFVAGIFRVLSKLLAVSKFILFRRWLPLLIGIVAGGLIGLLFYHGGTSNYKVTMVVNYTELNKKVFSELMDQLQLLAATDSRSTLASELRIPYAQAQNIKSIDGESFTTEPLNKDTSSARQVRIVVGLKKPVGTDSLQAALIGYLNNLPYLKTLKQAKIHIYENQLAFVQSEQGKLDTLKNEFVRSLGAGKMPSTSYHSEVNPAELYHQSSRLDSLREATTLLLSTDTQYVAIISGFKPTENPIRYSQSVSIAGFMLIGFLIAFIFLLVVEINKRLNGVA